MGFGHRRSTISENWLGNHNNDNIARFQRGRLVSFQNPSPAGKNHVVTNRWRWHLTFILATYVVLSIAYSLSSPLYEPTDELRHVRYVRHLIAHRSLPVQQQEAPRAQSHHPPLYYTMGALVSWWVPVTQDVYYEPPSNPHWTNRHWEVSDDNKNQYLHGPEERFPFQGITLLVYIVRWMTALLGAGAVWLTYRLGLEVFPDRPALAIGGTAIIAFNPQFIYLSGAVNNDIPATLCGAAVMLMCIRLIRRGPNLRSDVILGLLYGLALLTKFHLLALLVPIELAYAWVAWRERNWRVFLRANAVILSLTTFISGWWFWRNYQLYGDPTGIKKVNELWAGRPAGGNWWAIRQGLPYLWSSLWGRFGYGQLPLPQVIYRGLLIFCSLALAGYLLPQQNGASYPVMLLLGVTCLVFVTVVLYYIMIQPAGAMGRFLFPVLPAFALLLVGGLQRFFTKRMVWPMSIGVTVGMMALAIFTLVRVLAPAFNPPRALSKSEIESLPNPVHIQFGHLAQLMGYRISPTTIQPGETLNVTLYWQALNRTDRNHVVFVHLISEVGTMVAQRDSYPGLGRYPTINWEPGVTFADTYRVHVPETAYTPDRVVVQIGLYLPDGPRIVTKDGQDAVQLSTVEILPQPGDFPNSMHANFDNRIELVGYNLDRRTAHPGGTLHLTLYWRVLAQMEKDYQAFVHILGSQDQIWANSDSLLIADEVPSSQWEDGRIIKETRTLAVVDTTPVGFYDIEVGLHTPENGRLPVLAPGGHRLGSRVLLSKIRVID